MNSCGMLFLKTFTIKSVVMSIDNTLNRDGNYSHASKTGGDVSAVRKINRIKLAIIYVRMSVLIMLKHEWFNSKFMNG